VMTTSPPPGAVRVRFAPSPTGNLHLGGARTALFNWLFARRHGGVFLLRIEDTDRERSKPEYTREILESLQWLGLCHDEELRFQSRRMDGYRAAAGALEAAGLAYHCFCAPADLDARRKEAEARKETFRYDRRCAALPADEVATRRNLGEACALRLRIPDGTSSWDDLVRGRITFEHRQFDDFVIMKSDGMPTYHFAVVVDDIEMSITHVIRGEDHISNTPRQLILYEAFGKNPPVFAHIPLIHGTDGGRMSKRHGATAVSEYRREGFLAEALVNYLALLGWSPGEDREILPPAEMVGLFDLGRVVKTPAVFDMEKLRWMNGQYVHAISPARRVHLLAPFWIEAGLLAAHEVDSRLSWLEELVTVVGDRYRVLSEIVPLTEAFFRDVEPDEAAAKALAKAAADRASFAKIVAGIEGLAEFTRAGLEEVIRGVMASDGLGAGRLMQPLRAAVCGRMASPGLFETMELVGREACLRRIRNRLL
jgi:glutamyl-tRNA synthetase